MLLEILDAYKMIFCAHVSNQMDILTRAGIKGKNIPEKFLHLLVFVVVVVVVASLNFRTLFVSNVCGLKNFIPSRSGERYSVSKHCTRNILSTKDTYIKPAYSPGPILSFRDKVRSWNGWHPPILSS